MSLKKVHSKSEVHSSPCCFLENLSSSIHFGSSSPPQANNVPKLQGLNYVAKNYALIMMLKALHLAQFLSALLLK